MKEVKIPREEIWLVILLGKLLEQQDILGYQGLQKELEYVQLQEQTDSLCTTSWKSELDKNISLMCFKLLNIKTRILVWFSAENWASNNWGCGLKMLLPNIYIVIVPETF